MDVRLLDPRNVRDITPLLVDNKGRLKVVPAEALRETTPEERMLFCVLNACYVLPTLELVEHLRTLIAGRRCIEIGAGNGLVAQALGIPATDSRQQESPDIRALYKKLRQPVISYGANVEKLDALAAIQAHQPEVVLACWVTHRFDPHRSWAEGNQDGVDEMQVLQGCQEYLFVGNDQVHRNKAIWDQPHEKTYPDYIFSRAANGSRDFLARWRRGASSA